MGSSWWQEWEKKRVYLPLSLVMKNIWTFSSIVGNLKKFLKIKISNKESKLVVLKYLDRLLVVIWLYKSTTVLPSPGSYSKTKTITTPYAAKWGVTIIPRCCVRGKGCQQSWNYTKAVQEELKLRSHGEKSQHWKGPEAVPLRK